MRRGERRVTSLPWPLLIGLSIVVAGQMAYHRISLDQPETDFQPLEAPLGDAVYHGVSMGSTKLVAYFLSLDLQLHDTQTGQHFSYRLLDYRVLVEWLELINRISPRSEYPAMLASRIYTQTGDDEQLRLMLDFVERRFDLDPQLHWRRLAESSVIARHRLRDLELALKYARKLARQPASVEMPRWARDFEFLLLAELSEYEASIAIIQALLESDSIKHPDEKKFLRDKLSEFQQRLLESRQTAPN